MPAVTGFVDGLEPTWTMSAPDPIDAFVVDTTLIVGEGTAARWTFVLPPGARTLVRPRIPDAPATTVRRLTVVDLAGADYAAFRPTASEVERFSPRRAPIGYDLQAWHLDN